MRSQHRATPKDWKYMHERTEAGLETTSCLLELRDRVEALEAAANNRQHGEAAERAEPDPAASLVDRVANAIFNVPHDSEAEDCAAIRTTFKALARAAIREVAAWLRSEYPRREGYGTAWANLIEEETNR